MEDRRDYQLRYKYNITLADYEVLFDGQGGLCKICGQTSSRLLVVDHDHATGKIRGLLCSNCNSGIGLLKDDIKVLANAISYLTESNKSDII